MTQTHIMRAWWVGALVISLPARALAQALGEEETVVALLREAVRAALVRAWAIAPLSRTR
jgi:hypothetical protein